MPAPAPAIETEQLTKDYGSQRVVDHLDLRIAAGLSFGLLGRNGSGKTTTLHMLSTLIRPTAGRARVAGFDVVTDPVDVRRNIGLVFQESALDRSLTVRENLDFTGALCNLSRATVRRRCDELLALFELQTKHATPVAALSGGMRRAVDIARGVLHRPQVLFLDEPTVGLDVINRRAIWRFVERLRREEGTTVVVTTHYLEEAEDCDHAVFMSGGRIIGAGRPRQLIDDLGAYILEVDPGDAAGVAEHLGGLLGPPLEDGRRLLFRVTDPDFPVAELQQDLKARIRALQLRRPDLNDVYVWLHGSRSRGERP